MLNQFSLCSSTECTSDYIYQNKVVNITSLLLFIAVDRITILSGPNFNTWVGGWVGQWVNSSQIIKNQVNCHLIKIIEFCLKIYDLWIHSHLWIGLWVGGLVGQWAGSCQIIKNRVNHHLIEIVQFCLKIYDLWRHTLLWVGGWVDGLLCGSVGGVMSNH